jgi:hypothetical protein
MQAYRDLAPFVNEGCKDGLHPGGPYGERWAGTYPDGSDNPNF